MKRIQVFVPALLRKTQQMFNDGMEMVQISFIDGVMDQEEIFPAFMHFEAFTREGCPADYETIDSI